MSSKTLWLHAGGLLSVSHPSAGLSPVRAVTTKQLGTTLFLRRRDQRTAVRPESLTASKETFHFGATEWKNPSEILREAAC